MARRVFGSAPASRGARVVGIDIGEEDTPYVIEPLQDPVPGREVDAPPEFAPVEEPDRELVPA